MMLNMEVSTMAADGAAPAGLPAININLRVELTPVTAVLIDAIAQVLGRMAAASVAAAVTAPPPPELVAVPPAAATKSPGPAHHNARPWSEARVALLRRDYPTGRPVPALRAELVQLPGPPLTIKQVCKKAFDLDLKRPAAPQLVESQPDSRPAPASASPPAPEEARPLPSPSPSPPGRGIALPPRLVPSPAVAPEGDAEPDTDGEPVPATMSSIIAWARRAGGFPPGTGTPLPEVNARRAALGLPPFALLRPTYIDDEDLHARHA